MRSLAHGDLEHGGGGSVIVPLFDFINSGTMHIPFAFQVDALSSIFFIGHHRYWIFDSSVFDFLYEPR